LIGAAQAQAPILSGSSDQGGRSGGGRRRHRCSRARRDQPHARQSGTDACRREPGRRRRHPGGRNVKRAAPDGYTLLYVNAATHGLLPALKKSMPYDAQKDFIPIVMAVRAPLAIVVRSESPYKTLADLVKGADTKTLNYGSPGPGNTSHLVGLMLASASKARCRSCIIAAKRR
jgi:hypothetical protein